MGPRRPARLLLLPGGKRAVILVDEPSVLLRHALGRTGGEAIVETTASQTRRRRTLGLLERDRELHFQLLPASEVLLERLGARRGAPRVECLGLRRAVVEVA